MGETVAGGVSKSELQSAIDDFEQRTLSCVGSVLERLLYIASLRDYNSGVYVHEGLIASYGSQVAQHALAACHRTIFDSVVRLEIGRLLDELRFYFAAHDRLAVLHSWQKLKAYQTLKPMECDSLSGELFDSNMKMALIVMHLSDIRNAEAPNA